MKNIIKNLTIFILSITLIEVFGLAYYNNLIFEQEKNGIDNATVVKEGDSAVKNYNGMTQISDFEIGQLATTEDHSYLAYTDLKNQLFIHDLNKNTKIDTKKESEKIIYLKWIRNDTLFFATEKVGSGSKEIAIHTYTISNKAERIIKNFTQISSTSGVKKIAFSEFTNDVYILIGNSTISRIYHFDTNGNMSSVESQGKYITDIEVTNTDNTLFMEELKNGEYTLYKRSNQTYYLEPMESNVKMLGVIENTLYMGVVNESGQVKAVKRYQNGGAQDFITLKNPTDKEQIYLSQQGEVFTVDSVSVLNENKGSTQSFPTTGSVKVFGDAVLIQKENTRYLLNKEK